MKLMNTYLITYFMISLVKELTKQIPFMCFHSESLSILVVSVVLL